jgi:hypothetical protein
LGNETGHSLKIVMFTAEEGPDPPARYPRSGPL